MSTYESREEDQILERRQEWISCVNNRAAESYGLLLSENVIWIPPSGHAAVEGRAAFVEWVRPFFERFQYRFRLHDLRLQIRGNWAIERGAFDTHLTTKTGDQIQHEGSYIVLWHRKDGIWYIDRYIDDT